MLSKFVTIEFVIGIISGVPVALVTFISPAVTSNVSFTLYNTFVGIVCIVIDFTSFTIVIG